MLEAILAGLVPQEPEHIADPARLPFGFGRLIGPIGIVDEEAGAVPRLDVAGHDELVVGMDHREIANIVGGGELTDGGQAGAGTKRAIVHQAPDTLDDLLGQRLALRRFQTKQHMNLP